MASFASSISRVSLPSPPSHPLPRPVIPSDGPTSKPFVKDDLMVNTERGHRSRYRSDRRSSWPEISLETVASYVRRYRSFIVTSAGFELLLTGTSEPFA